MVSPKAKTADFNKAQFSEYSFSSGADTERNKSKGDGNKEIHDHKYCEHGFARELGGRIFRLRVNQSRFVIKVEENYLTLIPATFKEK